MEYSIKLNFKYLSIQTYPMPEETYVMISVSTQTKQNLDEHRGTLSYTEYLKPLVEKDEG
jgi:hypothetical protein